MPPLFHAGGTVLVHGLRYDLGEMIGVTEQMLEHLVAELGECQVTTEHAEYDAKISWPDPGRDLVRDILKRIAEIYDAVAEPLIFLIGPLTLKAYLFGTAHCLYDEAADALLRADGVTPIDGVDPGPEIQVWGMDPSDPARRAKLMALRFPHADFGDGEGPIRIRCVTVAGR